MAERQIIVNGSRIRVRYSELTREWEEKLIKEVITMAETAKAKKGLDDKRLATEIKEYLDGGSIHGGDEAIAWHVVVGQHFVCSLKHEGRSLIFFDLVDFHKSVLAFKSG